MRSWLVWAMPLSLTLVVGLSALPTAGQQAGKAVTPSPHPAAPATLDKTVWAYFDKNCAGCHDAETRAGALDMASLRRPNSLVQSRETWETITRKIKTGEMPPKDSPRPDAAQSLAVTRSIEGVLERIDRATPSDPGRVTAHRLNRAEYNNTVRDLLGVSFRPADDFPQDDSGYGFDNIGDVLSLSPSQMEKYVAASEKIARTAVFGPEMLAPTLIRHEGGSRRIEGSKTIPAHYDTTGLTIPNSLHTTHHFPVDGEYIFRIGTEGLRPQGSDAVRFAVWVDGKQAYSVDFDPEGEASFNPDRQDFSSRTQECRLPVTAGDHWIAATVENLYDGLPPSYKGPNPSKKVVPPPVFKVRPGFPPERLAEFKKRFEERQKEIVPVNEVRVSRLEIGGPYHQAKGASEATLRHIFVCGHLHGGHTSACTPKIIGNLASRAFRRPATPQEITRLSKLVTLAQQNGDSYEEGICLALQGILVSPHFLFRIERDPAPSRVADQNVSARLQTVSTREGGPPPTTTAAHPLTQYELASRLSYFLWSSMPDDQLRACAGNQTLRKPEVLAAQVRRMLHDPKSRALSENFGGQWLQFRALESVKPDRQRFPNFDTYLRLSMRQETEMFLDNIVRNDGNVLDLLFGKYTFLNERLANFYGLPGVTGPAFRRVNLAGTGRGGILTQASVLTVTSYPNRTSPVLRGKWILENILNAPPPAPPPGVPNLDTSAVGSAKSLREQLEEHRKNPTCASCHSRMDPLGFGLENFDAIGEWRKKDGEIAIDSSGSLPDGRTFAGPDGLKTVLASDREAFVQCLSAKLLTYALGRGLERYDKPAVRDISRHVAAKNYHFDNLVLEIVSSRPFQMRKGQSL